MEGRGAIRSRKGSSKIDVQRREKLPHTDSFRYASTGDEIAVRDALKRLDVALYKAACFLRVSDRTCRKWANGRARLDPRRDAPHPDDHDEAGASEVQEWLEVSDGIRRTR